jgi:cystathionine gamma-synthase
MSWEDGKGYLARICFTKLIGRSATLNPHGRYYDILKSAWQREYEDNYWAEDVIFIERNSRDFVIRAERINRNTEALCDLLVAHPRGM